MTGYPATVYARGDPKGMPKSTGAPAQARHCPSHALLAGLLMRSDWPTARVVLAFPAMPTFTNLAVRVAQPLRSSGIEVWLVHMRGHGADHGLTLTRSRGAPLAVWSFKRVRQSCPGGGGCPLDPNPPMRDLSQSDRRRPDGRSPGEAQGHHGLDDIRAAANLQLLTFGL